MNQQEKDQLTKDIKDFESQKFELSPVEAQTALIKILTPLLNSEGYILEPTGEIKEGTVKTWNRV